MIVVAIMGILSAVAVPAYYNHIMRSRQYEAAQVLLTLKAMEEIYRADTGAYTSTIGNLDGFSGAPSPYTSGYYQYSVTVATTTNLTIIAAGDLNGDGNAYDGWTISANDNNPSPMATGGDEGFSWSTLAAIFD